ncbi:MAG: shikimate kinase [Actinomycetota bacterium]
MTTPRLIVLVGMMGSGKSSVARRLAREGRVLLDTDTLVEERTGRTVREIFATDGEPVFRELETSVLEECLGHAGPAVIAAAGGVAESERNRTALHRARAAGSAFVVWLRTDPQELVRRVGHSTNRPLLDADAGGRLLELAASRAVNYRAVADVVVDTDGMSVQDVAAAVNAAVAGAGAGMMDADGPAT